MRLAGVACVLVAALAGGGCGGSTPSSTIALFDGETLDGWRGNHALWSVVDGAITGKTDGTLPHNTFLIHEGNFDDFTLTLEFRLHNHNSGVQFRSRVIDELGYAVAGDQADIADDGVHMGTLSDEKGRGVLALDDAAAVAADVHAGDWNGYRIHADGPRIDLAINDLRTVTYVERSKSAATSGVVALQLHTGVAMQVDFRNIEIGPP